MTSRELVYQTLEYKNTSGRVPRDLWTLPWADIHYPDELAKIQNEYPVDIIKAPEILAIEPETKGNPYQKGIYIDPWGCVIENIQPGVVGEAKQPIIKKDDWSDAETVHIPEEWLTFDRDAVNRFCGQTDCFVLSACCPRPFEQLQFLRGTENLYMDLMDPPAKMLEFIGKMHDFYCRLLTEWAKTDVDGLTFMDDWGSQNALLINPKLWKEIFYPLYKDYISIAHKYGKKAFMHSDGNTLAIFSDLIDIGLDAINSQIFCIGVEKLKEFKGKITFWGEIDRQNLIPNGTIKEIQDAVDLVYDTLWNNGGCIAQCEFGPGANPVNVEEIYKQWNKK